MKFIVMTALLFCTGRQAIAMENKDLKWSAIWAAAMIVTAYLLDFGVVQF